MLYGTAAFSEKLKRIYFLSRWFGKRRTCTVFKRAEYWYDPQ